MNSPMCTKLATRPYRTPLAPRTGGPNSRAQFRKLSVLSHLTKDVEDVPGLAQGSKSVSHQITACGGQARHLSPAVRGRVVDLRRAETVTGGGVPAEDVELAIHRC